MQDASPQPRLERSFFERDAATVAREMIGTTLVFLTKLDPAQDASVALAGPDKPAERWVERRARIVETEAYVGTHDLASHASKGRTARTSIMFGPPGHAYVYLIYGMYELLNVVTGDDGDAQAVLIRAAEALPTRLHHSGESALSAAEVAADTRGPRALQGPGKLTRSLGITRALNGADVCIKPTRKAVSQLWFEAGTPPNEVVITPRIGVDYAGEWRDAPLRFLDRGSPAVSRPPRSSGR